MPAQDFILDEQAGGGAGHGAATPCLTCTSLSPKQGSRGHLVARTQTSKALDLGDGVVVTLESSRTWVQIPLLSEAINGCDSQEYPHPHLHMKNWSGTSKATPIAVSVSLCL